MRRDCASWVLPETGEFRVKECSKSIVRRLADSNFIRKYFVGSGLDIGGKPDPLALYQEFFCRMTEVRTWDLEDGDAQFLEGVADDSVDFVHSSHCLEHMVDPKQAVKNWLRVVRPGGHVIVTVADEDLYEQGVFPSTFNRDHKWTFTIYKAKSWSPRSVNIIDLVVALGDSAELVRLEQINATYRYELPRYDQTLTPVAECAIEFIIRKRASEEMRVGGLIRRATQPPVEIRRHLNQYREDIATLKAANQANPPWSNDSSI